MSGKQKQKLDFAAWITDIFDNDKKVDHLLDAQGWKGFGVYFYLCQKAYGSNGYYFEFCYDDCASISKKMGGGMCGATVRETVMYCLQIGLFDNELFNKWNILTSKGIQRNYYQVLLKRRIKKVNLEFWLLNQEESEAVFSVQKIKDVNVTHEHMSATNEYLHSKEYSIDINTSAKQCFAKPIFLILKEIGSDGLPIEYEVPNDVLKALQDAYPKVDIYAELMKMKAWTLTNVSKRKTKRGIKRFINSWIAGAAEQRGGKKNELPNL